MATAKTPTLEELAARVVALETQLAGVRVIRPRGNGVGSQEPISHAPGKGSVYQYQQGDRETKGDKKGCRCVECIDANSAYYATHRDAKRTPAAPKKAAAAKSEPAKKTVAKKAAPEPKAAPAKAAAPAKSAAKKAAAPSPAKRTLKRVATGKSVAAPSKKTAGKRVISRPAA